jgi:hypothetical protein
VGLEESFHCPKMNNMLCHAEKFSKRNPEKMNIQEEMTPATEMQQHHKA